MEDLMYVIGVIVITVIVVILLIVRAKKRLDAISAETFSEDTNMQVDKISDELPIEEDAESVDALFDSPHYNRYKSLFNYVGANCHGRDEPGYKFEWLLQSLDMGRELEADGFYVRESIIKDLPYFCETEHEFDMFFKSQAPVLRGSVKGMLDMISFYLYSEKHPSKLEYWKQQLSGLAQDGNFEAQAALCSHDVGHMFQEQELESFKKMYEPNLMRLAEAGNPEAQLAVGEFLTQKLPPKIAWLLKAAQQGLGDAWCQLGLTYESMIDTDDDGQSRQIQLSNGKIHQLMIKKAECLLNGANTNNGIMAAWCQYMVGGYYAEGELLPKDLQKAAYWFRQAIENGENAQESLDSVLCQIEQENAYSVLEITKGVTERGSTMTLEESVRQKFSVLKSTTVILVATAMVCFLFPFVRASFWGVSSEAAGIEEASAISLYGNVEYNDEDNPNPFLIAGFLCGLLGLGIAWKAEDDNKKILATGILSVAGVVCLWLFRTAFISEVNKSGYGWMISISFEWGWTLSIISYAGAAIIAFIANYIPKYKRK